MMEINTNNKVLLNGILMLCVLGLFGCKDSGPAPSDLTGITNFSLQNFSDVEFTIDQNAGIITNGVDSLPFGTDASSLIAEFETVPKTAVTVNGEEQVSGSTENDYTSPVTYTATAEDGETTEEYLVTVTVAQQNPEAVSWSQQTGSASWGPFTQSITALPYQDELWVLGFSAGDLYFDEGDEVLGTFNSTDGASWMEVAAEDNTGKAMPAAVNAGLVNYDGKMWLVNGVIPPEGFSFEEFTTKSWYTTDGISWTEVDTTGTGSNYVGRESHNTVVFNDRIYTIGGFSSVAFGNPAAPRNDVWSTTDGMTWTEETDNAGFEARYYPAAFVFDGAIWITGGRKNDGTLMNDIWKSADGVTWTEVNANNAYTSRFGHTVVVYDSRLWLIGGEGMEAGSSTTYSDLWVSVDGSDWQKVAEDEVIALPANFDGRARHATFVYDDKIWIMGGYRINGAGDRVYMNDVWRGQLNALSN